MNKKLYIEISVFVFLMLAIFYALPGFRDTGVYALVTRAVYRIQTAFISLPAADKVLSIAFDKQDHALSCEAAVLKMALAYRGVSVSEGKLIADIGADSTPKHYENGTLIWGDPHKGFVGDINGRMPSTGYGVYWEAVARAANKYRTASAFSAWSVADLAGEINRGNPVLIWGHLGPGTELTWQTPAGKLIDGISYEHAFLVTGFNGLAGAPEGFFIIDPIYGKQYWTAAELSKHWSSLGNSGVVVY